MDLSEACIDRVLIPLELLIINIAYKTVLLTIDNCALTQSNSKNVRLKIAQQWHLRVCNVYTFKIVSCKMTFSYFFGDVRRPTEH